jgi:Zn-dependent protease with chaperone function
MNEQGAQAAAVAIAKAAGVAPPEVKVQASIKDNHPLRLVYPAISAAKYRLEISGQLLKDAPDEVLRALIAHEVGHINSRSSRLEDIGNLAVGWVTSWSAVGTFAALWCAAWLTAKPWLVVASFALPMLALGIVVAAGIGSRREEYKADRFAATAVGADKVADALRWLDKQGGWRQRIVNKFPTVLSSHPTVHTRVHRLGVDGHRVA